MTRRIMRMAAGVLVAVATAGCGAPQATRDGTITVAHAWTPVATNGEDHSFVYGIITSDADDRLTGATVPITVARHATVQSNPANGGVGGHEGHLDGDGAPSHRHDESTGVALPRNVAVELRPGHSHIVLEGLTQPLRPGDSFTMTLQFAGGASVDIAVVVIDDPSDR